MSDPLITIIYDVNKTCRVCLNDENVVKPLTNGPLREVFVKFTHLEISESDGLPSKLCSICFEKLNSSSSFLELCIKSDRILKHQKIIKSENNDDINTENSQHLSATDISLNNLWEVNCFPKHENEISIENLVKNENNSVNSEENLKLEVVDSESDDNFLEEENDARKVDNTRRKKSVKNSTIVESKRPLQKRKHIEIETNSYKFEVSDYNLHLICPRCGEHFLKSDRLEAHYRVHLGKKPELCEVCNKEFSKPERLEKHLLQHFKTCSKCGEKFDTKEGLKIHKNTHKEKRNIICHICGKSIGKSLKNHMAFKHCDRKPFSCNLCPKAFKNSTLLKTHLLRHADVRKYICSICGHRAIRKWDLDKHMTSHSEAKPFACKFCPKTYKTNQYLTQHNKVHTGERPYKCDMCPMGFRASTVLKNHRRLHTGEKPHVCNICNKAFTQKIALVSHMKIHR